MTGWGSVWLNAILHLYPSASGKERTLARGRAYLRTKRVVDVAVEGGTVRARIVGHRRLPYHVMITVRPIAPDVWHNAIRLIAEDHRCAAAIRHGVLSSEIVSLFDSAGDTLISRDAYAVAMKCGCDGRTDICEHIMALHLWIAAAINSDPFVLFTLRGCSRDTVLKRIGDAGQHTQSHPYPSVTNPTHQLLGPDAAGAGFDCWRAPVIALSDNHDTAALADRLIAQLGDPPGWDAPRSLHEILSPVYRGVARRARSLLSSKRD
jgi:uncharacterized Zn finger protein